MTRRLAIFDCDGTLVDSQHSIVAAMASAFAAVDLPCPSRADCLAVVGLSLPYAIAQLAPDVAENVQSNICDGYKSAFRTLRTDGKLREPLYAGITELLEELEADGWLLAVATGKSDRGLRLMLEHHGLSNRFISLQAADHHPSKPHPSMIEAALSEADVMPENAVMIGDTSYDMLMAAAAGVRAIGVGWGYHEPDELMASGAVSVAMDSAELGRHIGLHDRPYLNS